jgi:hypothetical protein
MAKMLQGSSLEILTAYQEVLEKKKQLQAVLQDCEASYSQKVFQHMVAKAAVSNSEITMPRVCGRQTLWQNYQANSPEVYYRVSVFQPYVTDLIAEVDHRYVYMINSCVFLRNSKLMSIIVHLFQYNMIDIIDQ